MGLQEVGGTLESGMARIPRNVTIDENVYQAMTNAVEWIKSNADPGYSMPDLVANAAFVELVRLRAAFSEQLDGADFPPAKEIRRGRNPRPNTDLDSALRPHIKAPE